VSRVVEPQHPVVAQQHDGRGGEALGHRRDTEDRVRVRRRTAGEQLANAGRVHEFAIRDDTVGQARLTPAGGEALGHLVDFARIHRHSRTG